MDIKPLKLKGSFEIQLHLKGDKRGYFMRSYDGETLAEYGLQTNWVQENQSLSTRINTIRGLHFLHPPHTETKLLRCVRGRILDVFIDLRKDSETFGQWDSIELSEDNHKSVYVPKGFANGFLTLSKIVLAQYKVDSKYVSEFDDGIRWNDPDVGIDWKIENPFLSERDKNLQFLADLRSPF